MSAHGLYRVALLAYPASFRREYGEELTRSLHDLRRHGGMSRTRLCLRIAGDVALTAPQMRLEALMARNTTLAVTAVVAIAVLAAAVGSPIFVLALVPVALLAILGRHHDRPISADRPDAGHWQRWILAGAAFFLAGGAVLALNGNEELSAVPWTVFALSWLTGTILVVYSLVVVVSQRLSRRPASPPSESASR